MPEALADQKLLGYLGRALSLELSAVQTYSTQARLVASWGLSEAAARLRHEAEEELEHVNRIIEHMLATGVAPGASQLRPVSLARDLTSLLRINQQFENELIELYGKAASHFARIGDQDHREFFEGLLEDERLHHRELQRWQASLQPALAATA